MKTKEKIICLVLIILAGSGGFWAGIKYQQNKQPFFGRMRREGSQQRLNANMIRGELIDKKGDSITVKLPDGSSKIILLSEKTTINKSTEGTLADLEKGRQVVVFGQTNSDGSIIAQNIQLNPILRNQP